MAIPARAEGAPSCGEHYRICSPLSDRSYAEEITYKKSTLTALIGLVDEFVYGTQLAGYRTKVEFSFWYEEGEGLSLAFFNRGGKGRMKLPEGCALVSPKMNEVALSILSVIRALGIDGRSLKTLIIRESKASDERVAALYVKDEQFAHAAAVFTHPLLKGMMIIHSDRRSPASVTTRILSVSGTSSLTETIAGKHITYGYDAFFQNNIPVFEMALDRMRPFTQAAARLIDLYCGVGTIGIALSENNREVVGLELSESMAERANENAKHNGLLGYRAFSAPAENAPPDLLTADDCVIVDPPRAGLHAKTVALILSAMPQTVVYLSCNPETQARDLDLLNGKYTPAFKAGFDFYPGTLHMESLVVLTRNR